MTTGKANIFVSLPASLKSVNSILKSFGEKLKNYIAGKIFENNQAETLLLLEELDPRQEELNAIKGMAYDGFCEHIFYFLIENPAFSIKHLNSFKDRMLKYPEKESLFSKSENMEILFLIDLVNEIRKLKQKINKDKRGIFTQSMEKQVNEMLDKMNKNLPEDVCHQLENHWARLEIREEIQEFKRVKEEARQYYSDDLEEQENYLEARGFEMHHWGVPDFNFS